MSLGYTETIPKAKSIKENIDELDFDKIENFYYLEGTVMPMKRQATDTDVPDVVHLCENHVSQRDSYPEV